MRYLALLSVLSIGCSWVSDADLDCQLQLVDDDGDGYPLNEVEAGYEGNDRCSHLVAVDCDDGDAAIFPGAEDAFYDGIDADCGLDEDFDQDGDGYVLDEYEGVVTEGVDGSGTLPGGDCDDDAVSIFPGSNDLAYDGIDSDCSGNDDYDQDGDGYVPDEFEGLATTYVTGSGALPGGDCDDADASIYMGAKDSWYDGVDSDCMGDDDYDQDVDGHRDAATTKDGDDCDDLDDSSYPGALEVFGDGTDHDCDGGADTFGFTDLDSLSWVAPQSLIFRGTDTEVFLGATAEEFVVGANAYYDSAIALVFDGDDPAAGYSDYITWVRNFSDPAPNILTPGCDLYPTDEVLYGGVGIATGNTRQLVVRWWDRDTSDANAVNPPVTAPLSFDDLTLAMDGNGNIHAFGCTDTEDDQSLAYLWAEPDTIAGGNYDDTTTYSTRARTCDLDFYAPSGDGTLILSEVSSVDLGDTGDTGFAPTVERTDLRVYSFSLPAAGEGITLVDEASIAGYDPASVQVFDAAPDRYLVLAEPDENAISVVRMTELFMVRPVWQITNSSGVLTAASSAMAPSGMLYILSSNNLGELSLHYGLPGVTPTTQQVDFEVDFVVDETAVWVDATGGYLYLAASGYDPSMGVERVAMGYAAIAAPTK